jgi:hypothetical protein
MHACLYAQNTLNILFYKYIIKKNKWCAIMLKKEATLRGWLPDFLQ